MTEFKLNPIENKGKRVLTTAQLAEAYGTTAKTITDNFNNNKNRYIEGKHYYCLTGDELKAFKSETENFGFAPNLNKLYLWTERGSLLHAKSINTDRAWEVHDFLVDNYFRVSEMTSSYNEVLLQLVENQKVLERKIDALEKKIDTIEKQSYSLVKDVIDAVIEPCFNRLDDEIKKVGNTVKKSNINIIRSVSENIRLLGTYVDTLIKKIK